jgi:hypothetical protein
MACLDRERAGLCPRGGETAIDDFSVGHNLPIPVAARTVPGDPIRKCAFPSHDAEARPRAAVGLYSPKDAARRQTSAALRQGVALRLPKRAWRTIKWRDGAAEQLSSRFAIDQRPRKKAC